MKLVTVQMELVIDDEIDVYNKEEVSEYLNEKLYGDPEFFGDWGPENIIATIEVEDL